MEASNGRGVEVLLVSYWKGEATEARVSLGLSLWMLNGRSCVGLYQSTTTFHTDLQIWLISHHPKSISFYSHMLEEVQVL